LHLSARDPLPPPSRLERRKVEIEEQNSYNLAMAEYFQGLFELRRREPGDDLTTHLVQAEENGNTLTNEELTANIILRRGARDNGKSGGRINRRELPPNKTDGFVVF
jgi:cytochrome P450